MADQKMILPVNHGIQQMKINEKPIDSMNISDSSRTKKPKNSDQEPLINK